MLFPIKIIDINDPRVSIYRSLKAKHLESQGVFIAEGPKVIRALIESGIEVLSFLTTESFCKSFKELPKYRIPVYLMPRDEIQKVIGFSFHQGIMACARSPQKLPLEDVIGRVKEPHMLIALNGVNDPENVGLIARNAAAFGASAILVDQKTYDPYYRRAVRVSMGAIFRMPVIYVDGLPAAFKQLKERFGTEIIATYLGRKSKDISSLDMSGNICLVFGNEDKGIDADVLKAAGTAVKVPIEKGVDSLNVASASAIILREAFISRGKGPASRGQGKGKNSGKVHRKRRSPAP